MSDTKQQCPACGSIDRRVRIVVSERLRSGYTSGSYGPCFDSWHDSPVEGSGEPTSSGSQESGKSVWDVQDSARSPLPDSPSAAGSGARECYQIAHDAAKAIIKAASDRQDARFCRLLDSWTPDFAEIIEKALATHADHCTAPLREDLLEWKTAAHSRGEDLTAERTRREAAERKLKELRERFATLAEKIEGNRLLSSRTTLTRSEAAELVRAALRGKGE